MPYPNPGPSPSASALVTLNGVAARTPDGRLLFQDLTLALARERTGVVGRNGAGKTTLLDLVAGATSPAEGTVTRRARVARVAQTPDRSPGRTVADALGVSERWAVLTRLLAGQGDEDDLAQADWSLSERMEAALAGAGLARLEPERALDTLSGGERTRLSLAALALEAPDLILLDEPTNHLDIAGRDDVRDWLDRWPGGALVVSHDRALLRGMDRIVELSALGVAVHGGGYDLYAARKAQEREAATQELMTAERERERVRREGQKARERQARRDAAGRRFAASGGIPRIALGLRADRAEDTGGRGRARAARRLEAADASVRMARERVERTRRMALSLGSAGAPAGRTVLRLDQATFETAGRRLAGPVDLVLTGTERLAVTGPNGSGKTTLLKLMAGLLEPSVGWVERPTPASLLDQDAALLRPDETLSGAFLRLNPQATPNGAQAALARFLFRNSEAGRQVDTLSGGERVRAALACVTGGERPPSLLILDEPTNHLDLESMQAVEAALSAYDGALVVVSHDRDFLDAIGVSRNIAL